MAILCPQDKVREFAKVGAGRDPGSVHRARDQRVSPQASEWLHYPLQPQEGEIPEGWLPLEEAERREDHPRGPHEAEGPGHGGKRGLQLTCPGAPSPPLAGLGHILCLAPSQSLLPFHSLWITFNPHDNL